MQLGALFAAGHDPVRIANLTWRQVSLMATGIQMYHLDLAARIATGKSPIYDAAGRPSPQEIPPGQASGFRGGGSAPSRNEEAKVAELLHGVRHLPSGNAIGVKVGATVPPIDGFKLVRWLAGVAPAHRAEASAAIQNGVVSMSDPVPDYWRTK